MYERKPTIGEIQKRVEESQKKANEQRSVAERDRSKKSIVFAAIGTIAAIAVLNPGARDAVKETANSVASSAVEAKNHITGNPDCDFGGNNFYMTKPGDTVWAIASAVDGNTGSIAHRISTRNGIEGSFLPTGSIIELPVSCGGNTFPTPLQK